MQYSPRWLLASCSDSGGGFKLDLTDHNGCGQPVQCEVKSNNTGRHIQMQLDMMNRAISCRELDSSFIELY